MKRNKRIKKIFEKALVGKQIKYEQGWHNDYEMHDGEKKGCFTVTSVSVDGIFVLIRGGVIAHVLKFDSAATLIYTGVCHENWMLRAAPPTIAYKKYTLQGDKQ